MGPGVILSVSILQSWVRGHPPGSTYQVELIDFELFNGRQKCRHLKFGQDNHLVASIYTPVCYHDEAVDVTEREQAKSSLRFDAKHLPAVGFMDTVLHGVCNDISVGNHDRLGHARRTARVAEKRCLSSALPFGPLEPVELWRLGPLCNELLDVYQSVHVLKARHAHEPNLVSRKARCLGGLQADLQLGSANKEHLCARRLELVGEFWGRVRRIGGGDDAIESVDRVCDGQVVDLDSYRVSQGVSKKKNAHSD